jgi:hypothetical protein
VGFASFQGSTFELLETGKLAPILLDDEEEEDAGSEEDEEEEGSGSRRPLPPLVAAAPGGGCPHCAHKLHVKFVDMLTYPRPVRKFEVRFCWIIACHCWEAI